MFEGEDGRPCIKWRKKKTVRGIKEKTERIEEEPKGVWNIRDKEGEETEIGREEKAEAEECKDTKRNY